MYCQMTVFWRVRRATQHFETADHLVSGDVVDEIEAGAEDEEMFDEENEEIEEEMFDEEDGEIEEEMADGEEENEE
uniref:Uncharacterized protein n=2 Tax=Caenorhabditis tropicalis TaxID=1561998 RepID=A0A1I7TIR9_9PELO